MIIDGTSIKNQIHIETLSFSAIFQNICFTRLRLSDFSSNNHKMLENMTYPFCNQRFNCSSKLDHWKNYLEKNHILITCIYFKKKYLLVGYDPSKKKRNKQNKILLVLNLYFVLKSKILDEIEVRFKCILFLNYVLCVTPELRH
jgi:hypothetical protein